MHATNTCHHNSLRTRVSFNSGLWTSRYRLCSVVLLSPKMNLPFFRRNRRQWLKAVITCAIAYFGSASSSTSVIQRASSKHLLLHVFPRGGGPNESNPNWDDYHVTFKSFTASSSSVANSYNQKPPILLEDLDDSNNIYDSTSLLHLPSPPKLDSFQAVLHTARQYLGHLRNTQPDLFAVAAMSLAVFVAWQLPPLHGILQAHFICRKRMLLAGRLHVLWLSAVSHVSFVHLLFNMITLLSVGPSVKQALWQQQIGYNSRGPLSLWPLMLGAAATGSLAHALAGHREGSCGLSGVTLAFLAVVARRYPQREFTSRLFYGIVPVRLSGHLLLRVLLIGSALGSLNTRSDIAHVSHLAGCLFGMGYYELWQRYPQWRHYLSGNFGSFWKKGYSKIERLLAK
jgi:membrane associated rhomboid family serine protease